MSQDTYAVLGDLGGGKFIVRMYVDGHVVDEEFEAKSTTHLVQQIDSRMGKLSGGEARKVGEKVDEFKSDGHAIPLTPETGATD